jgi:phosphatidylglycerophosphate synthase
MVALDRAGFLRRWSDLHEGIDPERVPFVRGWLSVVYVAARPLVALRIAPWAVTVLGLLGAAAAALVCAAGGAWPVVASGLVLVSGLLDGLDGAVAVLTGRVSRWGALLDGVCDRVGDAAYGVGLWVLGAPAWVALAWVGVCFVSEYARARGQALTSGPVDVVSVGERPTRIIVAFVTLLAAGLVPPRAADAALVGSFVGLLTGCIGLVQVLVAVRRRLI